MPLEPDTLDEISTFVRARFDDRDRLLEIFRDELYAPGDLDEDELAEAVDQAMAALKAEEATWPDTTDCDRLSAAFTTLRSHKIIALHNAGMTQSDGHSDFTDVLAMAPDRDRIEGYCFYHWQDVERAVQGGGLYLAFGPTNPKEEVSRGPAVGNVIASTLEEAGLKVKWDGSFDQRILLPGFDWKRR